MSLRSAAFVSLRAALPFLVATGLPPSLASRAAAQCTGCPYSSFDRAGRLRPIGANATTVLAHGDWNGDGTPDLATAGYATLAILVGDGTLRFGAATLLSLPAGAAVNALAAADLDLDSDLDLATVNGSTNNVSVFLNSGGTFTGPTNFAVGSGPRAAVVGDFNRDGAPDLLTTTQGAFLVLLAGRGDGSFAAPATVVTAPSGISDVEAADFDGDGLLDVAVSRDSSAGNLIWYRGRGDGTFDPAVTKTATGGYPKAMAVGDLNGDGRPDVALLHTTESKVSLLLFSGGAFGSETVVPIDYNSQTVAVARVDGDAAADIVTTSWYESAASVHFGNGAGGVSSSVRMRGIYHPRAALVADLDVNGTADLVAAPDLTAASLSVFPGDGLGGFGPTRVAPADGDRSVATGDFDGDGRADLVALDRYSDKLAYARGLGDGTFAPAVLATTGLFNPIGLGVGDFDENGILDVIAGALNLDSVAFFAGGPGGLAAPVLIGTLNRNSSYHGIRVADFDRDGHLDFVTVSSASLGVYVHFGNGAGGFPVRRTAGTVGGIGPQDVAVLDFNRDGILDLAVSGDNSTVKLFQGSGNQTTPFTALGTTLATATYYPYGIAAGDFDKDGFVDLVVAHNSTTPSTVGLFRGRATTPYFEARSDYALGETSNIEPYGLAVADVNADAFLDLLVACRGGTDNRPSVRVLVGTGSSSPGAAFVAADPWLVAQDRPVVIAVADFDQDGRPDFATGESTRTGTNGISVVLNSNCTPRRLHAVRVVSTCNTAGTPFASQPALRIEDNGGNGFLCDVAGVTASIEAGTGTAGASLLGQALMSTGGTGVADWAAAATPLAIDLAGTKYQLRFTHPQAGFTLSRTFSLPAPLAISGPASYCQPNAALFSTAPGFDGYRWQVDPPSATVSLLPQVSVAAGALAPGAHSVKVDATVDTCPATATSPFSVFANLSPVAVSPGSAGSVCTSCPGPTLTASDTGGGPVSRRWGYRTVSGGAITFLAGETGATYAVHGQHFPGQGTYLVVEETTPQCGFVTVSNEVPVQVTTATTGDVVETLTVTSTSERNRLEWALPSGRTKVRVRYREAATWLGCTPPEDAGAGSPIDPDPVFPAGGIGSLEHTGLTNDRTYCYSLFVETATDVFAPAGRSARGRPFATDGAVKWAFSTGASSLATPGLGLGVLHVVSNDEVLHAMVKGSGAAGGQWPPGWRPFTATGPSQSRPTTVPLSVGPASRVVFLGSQSATGNNAIAVDADTGLGLWGRPLGTPVQAGPAGIFDAYYAGSLDLVLLGTRNSGGASAFHALGTATGASSAPWPYTGETSPFLNEIGIVSAQAAVDYPNERAFFTSYRRVPGTSDSVWCVDLTSATRCGGWAAGVTAGLGDVAASPTLRGGRLYVAPLNGPDSEIEALDADDGTTLWSSRVAPGDGQVKLFVVPDVLSADLYFSTTSKVWAISDGGSSAIPKWQRSIPGPSQPVFFAGTGRVYVGGGDGRLYVLAASDGQDLVAPVALGEPGLAAVGAPTVDQAGGFVYVGTEAGVVYAVAIP
jgi:hypothetical protein